VLAAIAAVDRAAFVPRAHVGEAYVDAPIPIGHRQVTTQPSLVARMVAALGLRGEERVLEIGAGLGWQTALLAALARDVWSVERLPELAAAARANLTAAGIANAVVTVGDGTLGLEQHAPYDAIVVSAAFPTVPPPLVAQLAPGGRLVQPIGPGGYDNVTLFERGPSGLQRVRSISGARFVKLYGRHGHRPSDAT
jgi:protein-L-isoaspartate(D-aspartate) O-methyltransferase